MASHDHEYDHSIDFESNGRGQEGAGFTVRRGHHGTVFLDLDSSDEEEKEGMENESHPVVAAAAAAATTVSIPKPERAAKKKRRVARADPPDPAAVAGEAAIRKEKGSKRA